MHYTLEHLESHAVMIIHEERLDGETASEFKAEILLHSRSGMEVLFVDLSEVEFCDSSGLSALLFAHREMKSAGGAAIFVGLSPSLLSYVTLSQLDRVLYLYESKEEALADLEGEDE